VATGRRPQPAVAASAPVAVERTVLRGRAATDYLLGSLACCACHPQDLDRLAPRALIWYRYLCRPERALVLPLGVVLDLGWLLLAGESFRFRGFFGDAALDRFEREVREAYEQRVLLRRLHETAFGRLGRLLADSREPDAVVARVLEILLAPAAAVLSRWFAFEPAQRFELPARLDPPAAARAAFEEATERPGAMLEQLTEVTLTAGAMDLDQALAEEDFYELAHIRLFPRESLRLAARGVKAAERLIGRSRRALGRALRDRALAATSMESIGTYPIGGLAELATRGPVENLVASELMWFEPDQPIDLFTVRAVENELLRYLRDSSVLHLMRHTVVFYLDECPEFNAPPGLARAPVTLKSLRWLLGLVLALTGELRAVFQRDDVRFELRLAPPAEGGPAMAAECREVAEVLGLLLRDQEEAGKAQVNVIGGSLRDDLAALRPEPGRFLTVVVLSRPSRLEALAGIRLGPQAKLVMVPVNLGQDAAGPGAGLSLTGELVPALRAARDRILEQVFA